MVHGHGPLGDGVERKFRLVQNGAFEGRVPKGQGIEERLDTLAVLFGRNYRSLAAGCQPELLHGFQIELEDDRRRGAAVAHRDGPIEIVLVGVLEIFLVVFELVEMEATVLYVAFELLGVRLAPAVAFTVLSTPCGERSDTRFAFVGDDIVRVAARIFWITVF